MPLTGNQKKIDANKDGKITSEDLKMLRKGKKKKTFVDKLKEKVKKANKKEYYALLAVLWWIPLGSVWCAIAIWLRSSNQIKSFLGLKKNLNE